MNEATEAEDAFVGRCGRWMADRLREGSPWRCWVAESRGVVTGHLWLQLIEKVPNPCRRSIAMPTSRTCTYGQNRARWGTCEALLEAALAFCREQQVDSVVLWPTERSQPLYARHGFAFPKDLMEAVLAPGRELH